MQVTFLKLKKFVNIHCIINITSAGKRKKQQTDYFNIRWTSEQRSEFWKLLNV